jgi:hypothetical protein
MTLGITVTRRSKSGFRTLMIAGLLTVSSHALAQKKSEFLPDVSALKQARDAMALELKDPYSAKFEGLYTQIVPNARGELTQVVCGSINAKNSYGAYVGARLFVYLNKLRMSYSIGGESGTLNADVFKRFCL